MKTIACAVLLSLFALPAMAQTAAKTPTRCMTLEEVDRTMDPVHLTRSMLACIQQGRDDDAVDLFNIGGVFAKFDTYRVADVSAHAAYGALKVQAGNALNQAQMDRFQAALKSRSGEPEYVGKLCTFADGLYPPSYAPTYMTNHGMGAFTGKPQMTENFQPNVAWEEVRSEYLGCGL
jgi:hypothetical protein